MEFALMTGIAAVIASAEWFLLGLAAAFRPDLSGHMAAQISLCATLILEHESYSITGHGD